MKVFVTGGTGYIGRELVHCLLKHGDEVVAMYRGSDPPWQANGLSWARADLHDTASMRVAMEGCEGVYHLAGLAGMWHPEKNAFFKMNVTATKNVLQAVKGASVPKLVFTSSAAVLSYSIRTPIVETDPQLEPFDEDYAFTKYLAEREILAEVDRGMHAITLLPPRVYGPGHSNNGTNPVNKLMAQFLSRPYYMVPGDGRFVANYVFMDDLVEGHRLAMMHGKQGERYILGGENHDYASFYKALSDITGLKRKQIGVPKSLMVAIAEGAEAWSALTGRPPAITRAVVNKLYSQRILNCEKAQRDLGYRITPLLEGLEITLKSIKKNGKL